MQKFVLTALGRVPHGKINEVKNDLVKLLGMKDYQTIRRFETGSSEPTLNQANDISDYFLNAHNITLVWEKKEVPEKVKRGKVGRPVKECMLEKALEQK